MFEVEIKAPSSPAIEKKVATLCEFHGKVVQEDDYFQHPCRDMKKTDEALRVRIVGGEFFLTYKGPKAKGDMKMRLEIEFPVDKKIYALLTSLGFVKTLTVKKTRRIYSYGGIEVALDDVKGLGKYIEIEARKKTSRKNILPLAAKLGLKKDSWTTKSYTQLLDEKRLR